jgi:hypothetical protein
MRVHLLTVPSIPVIWAVTHRSTNWAQSCLTLVIKWATVCPAWQEAVFDCVQFGASSVIGLIFFTAFRDSTLKNASVTYLSSDCIPLLLADAIPVPKAKSLPPGRIKFNVRVSSLREERELNTFLLT